MEIEIDIRKTSISDYSQIIDIEKTAFDGDEVLNVEIFNTLLEAKIIIERWRQHYNHVRPHSSFGYKSPAPEAVIPLEPKTILYAN